MKNFKVYLKNYFGFWLIFVFICLIASYVSNYDGEPRNFDFKSGFIFTSIIASFILANLIAKKYSKNEEIDELRKKEGLDYKEFNLKYGKVFEIYDK